MISKDKHYNEYMKIQLLPHHHTGKLSHHRHTSYATLFFLIMVCLAAVMTVTGRAYSQSAPFVIPGPEERQMSVGAVVEGKKPTDAPTIRVPSNGQTVTAIPITVQGGCPKDTLVKIFKNGVMTGAAICDNGSYTLQADLLLGANSLYAQAFNTLDKYGPASEPIVVTYAASGQQVPLAPELFDPIKSPANQFILRSENFHKGVYTGEEITWPIEIIGGTPPYAVSIGWGDGKTDLLSRGVPGGFNVKHIYDKEGTGYRGSYPITVKATDAQGAAAYIQLVTLVNNGSLAALSAKEALAGKLAIAWPLLILLLLVILSFFLGERREKHILIKKGLLDGTA